VACATASTPRSIAPRRAGTKARPHRRSRTRCGDPSAQPHPPTLTTPAPPCMRHERRERDIHHRVDTLGLPMLKKRATRGGGAGYEKVRVRSEFPQCQTYQCGGGGAGCPRPSVFWVLKHGTCGGASPNFTCATVRTFHAASVGWFRSDQAPRVAECVLKREESWFTRPAPSRGSTGLAGVCPHAQPGCPTRGPPPAAARQLHLLTRFLQLRVSGRGDYTLELHSLRSYLPPECGRTGFD